jgi:hypothetical protein
MKWIRVQDVTPYIKSGDYVDHEEDYSLARRLYSADGKKYPLLDIAIFADSYYSIRNEALTGIKISSSYKQKKGDWWDEHAVEAYLPLELLPELDEMIAEVKKKFS